MATKAVMETIQASLKQADLVRNKNMVKLHAGKFTWKELQARSFNAPALFISCLGWKPASDYDQTILSGYELAVEARFAVGIVTSDKKNAESRNVKARLIAEGLTIELIDQDWDLDNCLPTKQQRSEGLFVPAAEEDNCSMWLVTWHQAIGLNRSDLKNSIADWLSYHAEHYNSENPEQLMAEATVNFEENNNA